jgi:septum formation protein
MAVDIDESPRPGEPPAEYVRRLAIEKGVAANLKVCPTPADVRQTPADVRQTPPDVGQTFRSADIVILAADTTVVVDGEILGKPIDDGDAERMLRLLSGRAHEVLTGISLRRDGQEAGRVLTTIVRFKALSDAEISWYVRSGEGRDKAGAYAIQGLASRFIPDIEGSYANVVGLPVAEVAGLIEELGYTQGNKSRKSL